jgi:hypothetical protein
VAALTKEKINELIDAVKWSTVNVSLLSVTDHFLQNKAVTESLIQRAEKMKQHVKKLESGRDLDKEELKEIGSLKPEHVTGYSEVDRLLCKCLNRHTNLVNRILESPRMA